MNCLPVLDLSTMALPPLFCARLCCAPPSGGLRHVLSPCLCSPLSRLFFPRLSLPHLITASTICLLLVVFRLLSIRRPHPPRVACSIDLRSTIHDIRPMTTTTSVSGAHVCTGSILASNRSSRRCSLFISPSLCVPFISLPYLWSRVVLV